MKDYLTVVEFAAAGITKQAVYKRIKQDLAPYVKSKTEKRLYQNSGHEKDVTIEWIVLDVKAKDQSCKAFRLNSSGLFVGACATAPFSLYLTTLPTIMLYSSLDAIILC